MEVKVECACGQRYKFDVEPVNGQMPVEVGCPACGASGTEAANAVIRMRLAVSPGAGDRPVFRIGAAGPAPVESAPPEAAEAAQVPTVVGPAVSGVRSAEAVELRGADSSPAQPGKEPSLLLGVVGAVVAGVVGMVAWYLLCRTTGMKLRWLAIGVGALTGVGAKLLGRKASAPLGLWAAGVAFCCILGGQLLIAKARIDKIVSDATSAAYEEQLAFAKGVLREVPTGSDQEIRTHLAKQSADPGEAPDPGQATAEEVREFRDKELPRLRDLAGGKITKEKFAEDFKKLELEDGESTDLEETGVFKIIWVVMSFGLLGIVWLIMGVGSAYKTAAT